jgi:hypothetical protein
MLSAAWILDQEHLSDLFFYGTLLGGLFFLFTGAYAVAAALFGSFIGSVVGFLVSGWPSQHDHDLYIPIGATLFLIASGTIGLAVPPRMGRRALRFWGWVTLLAGLPATLVMVRLTAEELCRPGLCMTSSPATLWPWIVVVLTVLSIGFLAFLFFAQSRRAREPNEHEYRMGSSDGAEWMI